MKPLEEQLRKLAKKYIKEHGLMGTNANPVATWNVGFMEAVEWLIPHIQSYADRQAEQAKEEGLLEGRTCKQNEIDYHVEQARIALLQEIRAKIGDEYPNGIRMYDGFVNHRRADGYNKACDDVGVGDDKNERLTIFK